MQRPVSAEVLEQEDLRHLEDLWDDPVPCTKPQCCGVESLRGAWMSVAGRRPAELLFAGNRLTVHFADGAIYVGTITIGVNGHYGTLDVLIEDGPQRHKGLLALGIFELDGDTLRWCTASPGQAERPQALGELDKLHLHLVLRRERHGKR